MLIIAYAHYIGMVHSHSWKLGHYIADNVDHSVRTLYRYGTFHCMGIILATTPGIRQKLVVHKGQSSETNFLVKKFLLNITNRVLGKMLPNVTKNYSRSMHMMNVRTLTHYGKYLGRYVVRYYEKTTQDQCIWWMCAHWHIMEIILVVTKMSCIFSTLQFIPSENRIQGTTPIATFDQPL